MTATRKKDRISLSCLIWNWSCIYISRELDKCIISKLVFWNVFLLLLLISLSAESLLLRYTVVCKKKNDAVFCVCVCSFSPFFSLNSSIIFWLCNLEFFSFLFHFREEKSRALKYLHLRLPPRKKPNLISAHLFSSRYPSRSVIFASLMHGFFCVPFPSFCCYFSITFHFLSFC